jgi:hypothetical protein
MSVRTCALSQYVSRSCAFKYYFWRQIKRRGIYEAHYVAFLVARYARVDKNQSDVSVVKNCKFAAFYFEFDRRISKSILSTLYKEL